MAIAIHILGAGGSYPPPGYGGPSLLVEAPDAVILLDCGDSCASRLSDIGFRPCEVDAVYISHRHADHWSGLPAFLTSRAVEGCPETKIYSHEAVAGDLATLLAPLAPGNSAPIVEPVRQPVPLGAGFEVLLFGSKHPVPTFGVSIRERGSPVAAYTADTSYDPRLVEALAGHEVVVVDTTLPSSGPHGKEREYHMTLEEAWRLVRQDAEAGLAVAFHLSPASLAEARRARLPGLLVPGELSTLTLH